MKYIDNFLLKNLIQEIYLEEKQKMNESSTIEAIGTIAAMGAMPFLMGLIKNYLAYKNVPRDDIGAIVEDMKKDYNFMEDIKNLQSKDIDQIKLDSIFNSLKPEIDKRLKERGIDNSQQGTTYNLRRYQTNIIRGLRGGRRPGREISFWDRIRGKY